MNPRTQGLSDSTRQEIYSLLASVTPDVPALETYPRSNVYVWVHNPAAVDGYSAATVWVGTDKDGDPAVFIAPSKTPTPNQITPSSETVTVTKPTGSPLPKGWSLA